MSTLHIKLVYHKVLIGALCYSVCSRLQIIRSQIIQNPALLKIKNLHYLKHIWESKATNRQSFTHQSRKVDVVVCMEDIATKNFFMEKIMYISFTF